LKAFFDEKIKNYPQHQKKYEVEMRLAKRYYDNGVDLVELLKTGKPSKRYVIPFLLGMTDGVTSEKWQYKFVKPGSSGGIDIDIDFDPEGKEKIQEYLKEKFGEDRVLHVGTFTRLGPASAAKDLLRAFGVDYQQSNEFTTVLEHNITWQENLGNLEKNFPRQYDFYVKNKSVLDLTPYFINKIRQGGKHAGGIVILDRPVWERIPVDRISGELVTAFPESAQEQVLDEMGVVKFDILAITILDVIRSTIQMIDEKLFLIEENGIRKIVPESYLKGKEIENGNKDNISVKDSGL
jgi:hypothetical protein